MWIPASVDELERAARSDRLVEKKRFEAKREVGRNKDVAIDVNAMALDGGAVVYGIAEDANRRPTIPAPIELAGQRERIDQIVHSSCAEPVGCANSVPPANWVDRRSASVRDRVGAPQSRRPSLRTGSQAGDRR